jgi:hypothetical protein
MNPEPFKPDAIRCIDFRNGGIDIICADDIDLRADLNLNGIANEIADAVVFTNYFIYGLDAFTINVEGQTAASDANADGIPLSVADLVYIVRVITGDVLPIEKIQPHHATANFRSDGATIMTDARLGGVFIMLEGNAEASLAEGASHMQMKSAFDGVNTRVLIYTLDKGLSCTGNILNTRGEVVSIEASDYDGSLYKIGHLPESFTLTSYPNPFNPTTVIEMSLPIAADWKVEIYNVSGQRVASYKGYNEAGPVQVTWDAAGQSSGIYLIKASAANFKATRKAILLK